MYVIAFLIAVLITPQQPITKHIPSKHKQQQSASNTTNKTPKATPTNTPVQQQTSTDQTTQNQPTPSDRIYKVEVVPQAPDRWFKGYVIFTGLVAGLNIGMLVLMWLHWQAMRGQIDEMQKARQHDREMSKLEYRAWLQFDQMEGGFTQNGALNAKVRFKNSGRTPAKDVHMWYSQEKALAGNKPKFSYINENDIYHHVIPPHGRVNLTHGVNTFGVTNEQWTQIQRDALFVYLHGKMTYKDVFGDPHWLTFCFFYNSNSGTFRVSDYHNETDD
jgi:hypothetical protein